MMHYGISGTNTRRVYRISGLDRVLFYPKSGWQSVDLLAEHIGKSQQEILQMVASQFPEDVFERHPDRAPDEMMNRMLQWAEGICGVPVNAVPEVKFAPRQ